MRSITYEAAPSKISRQLGPCPLCGREMVDGPSLNEHHLIPKMYRGREKYKIHRVCHSKIHSVFSEVSLAKHFKTFEALRQNEDIAKFIKWVRKQDPEINAKHRRKRR